MPLYVIIELKTQTNLNRSKLSSPGALQSLHRTRYFQQNASKMLKSVIITFIAG